MHTVFWQVSLSNGEIFFEDKGEFEIIPGENSPWLRLCHYIDTNKLDITNLALYTKDGRIFNLPSAGKNPKFRPNLSGESLKPIDFLFFRYIDGTISYTGNMDKINDHFAVAEAVYPGGKRIQLWVDEQNINNTWVRFVR